MRIFAKTLIRRTIFIYKIRANPFNPFKPRSKKNLCESLRNFTTKINHKDTQRKYEYSKNFHHNELISNIKSAPIRSIRSIRVPKKTFVNLCEFSPQRNTKQKHRGKPRQYKTFATFHNLV